MAKKKSASSAADSSPSPAQSSSPPPPTTSAAQSRAAPRNFSSSTRTICKRSQLRYHETNPRIIDPHAFKKLKTFIKKNGLLGGIDVNRRRAANGFDPSQEGQLVILGGHQRTHAMDELAGFDPRDPATDYDVPVNIAEVSPGREREILVGLNNPGMQGAWDNEILTEVLTSPDVDPLATGFDRIELSHMLDSGVLEQIFGGGDSNGSSSSQSPSPDAAIMDAFEDIADSGRNQSADAGQSPASPSQSPAQSPNSAPAGHAGSPGAQSPSAPPALDPYSVEAMKDRRVDYRDTLVQSQAVNIHNYISLSASSGYEIERLLRAIDLPAGERFFDLAQFLERLGLDQLAESIRDPAESANASPADSSADAPADSADVDSLV